MKNKYIDLDLNRCVGCFACVVSCKDQHYDVNEEGPSLRQVVKYEDEVNQTLNFIAIGCMHCADSPCIFACPTGAIYRDEETGFVVVNSAKCVGCHSCLMACPFGAPKFDKNNKMTKCDGCVERVKLGLDPVCVKTCPSGALFLTDAEDSALLKKKKLLRNLIK